MPITAFIGVRISWLIVARNELLASLAASAAARASFVSLNRRTFWIAITAWSAKVSTRAISAASNGRTSSRSSEITPRASPSRSNGTLSAVRNPMRFWMSRTSGYSVSMTDRTSSMWIERRSRIERPAIEVLRSGSTSACALAM